MTARTLLRGQLAFLRDRGHDVVLICSPSEELDAIRERDGIDVIGVPMTRAITPLSDALALMRLTAALRGLRPDVVNASTPKAALLGMLAAFAAGVPRRVYVVRGLRYETVRGWRRRVLATAERLTSACAHDVVCVSESLRTAYRKAGLSASHKTVVLGAGSSNGIDGAWFRRTPTLVTEGRRAVERLGLRTSAPIVGFVGRLTRDKGIPDLAALFDRLRRRGRDVQLLIVGKTEAFDPLPGGLIERLAGDPDVGLVGEVTDPRPYYAVMDVLALPSVREGFPNAPLEAGCLSVPAVGYAATGTRDAILDGTTGALVAIGDVDGLADAIESYLANPTRRLAHGNASRERATSEFRPEPLWRALERLYFDSPSTATNDLDDALPIHRC